MAPRSYLQVDALGAVEYLEVEDLSEAHPEVGVEAAPRGARHFLVVVQDLGEDGAPRHVLAAGDLGPEGRGHGETPAPRRCSTWCLRAAPVPGAQLGGGDGAGGRQLRHQDGVAGPPADPGGLLPGAPLHGAQVGPLGRLRLRGAVLNGAF